MSFVVKTLRLAEDDALEAAVWHNVTLQMRRKIFRRYIQ